MDRDELAGVLADADGSYFDAPKGMTHGDWLADAALAWFRDYLGRDDVVERVKAAMIEHIGPVFGSPEYLADPVKLARATKRRDDAAENYARAALNAIGGKDGR